MLVGYARVSTTEQDIELQTDRLTAAGAEKLFTEQKSGKSANDRPILQQALEFVREGDTLLVTRLDRIARSSNDLHNIIHLLQEKGVGFRCVQQSEIDTTTSTGRLMIGMLGAIAQFENDLRRERQMEGIEKAKRAGVYKGRQPSIDRNRLMLLKADGLGATAIAKRLGINRSTVYKLIKG